MQVADRIHTVEEYYFSQKMREIRNLERHGKTILNLGIGNPDLPPPPQIISALQNAASRLSNHGYQPYKGLPELRLAMSRFYSKYYKVKLDPETEILPLAGSKEGILHISLAYLNPGDKVLIPNPGYATYANIAKILGATPVYYDLTEANHWEPNIEQLEKQSLSDVKLMWINYPHMPTGAPASIALFNKLVAFAQKHNILLVNDNPYSFILTEKPISIFSVKGAAATALELNSLSKSFNMAGWRIGLLVGASEHINNVLKIKSNIDSGMFYGLQAGAIEALEISSDWFTNLNNIYAKRRIILIKIIKKLGASTSPDSSGFFLWAKLPEGSNEVETSDKLLKEKSIFVTPGSIFGSKGKGYLRFSLCVNEKDLQELLDRL